MNNTIWLEPNLKDSIGHQVSEIGKIIQKNKLNSDVITLDFKKIDFIHPTTLLGIASLKSTFNKIGKEIKFNNLNEGLTSYFDIIEFPNGIFPDLDPNWSYKIDSFKTKSYLPIINFPADKTENSVVIRNSVLSKLNELLAYKLNLTIGQIGAVSYLISELTDNIVEHAEVKRGKIITQYYSNKGFLEICIIDEGKSILGSYQNSKKHFVDTHKKAIEFATQGKSTKSDERGFGIPTSINLIVKGLQGKLCLVSGNAMLVNTTIIDFEQNWNGTLLSIKIPKNFENINYRDFI